MAIAIKGGFLNEFVILLQCTSMCGVYSGMCAHVCRSTSLCKGQEIKSASLAIQKTSKHSDVSPTPLPALWSQVNM